MALILVEDTTKEPALFAAAAALVAAQSGARLAWIPPRFDISAYPDAEQHVLRDGGLGPSGLLWYERLTGSAAAGPAPIGEMPDGPSGDHVVVPIHPEFGIGADVVEAILLRARAAGIEVRRVAARSDDGGIAFDVPEYEPAPRDEFGRLLGRAPASGGGATLTIGLLGREVDHRRSYPAVVAALADAAEALDLGISLRMIAPASAQAGDSALEGLDGLILPGGSSMENVAGQIAGANAALATGLPTLGLCLGMQSMATAVARTALDEPRANLVEADPLAPLHTFVPMAGTTASDGTPLPAHRTGEAPLKPQPGSRLALIAATGTGIRYNHRYRLAPHILPALESRGIIVAASAASGAIVEAIEHRAHPFFLGLQGHPELSSRDGAPQPVFTGFLKAAALRRGH